MHGFGKQAVVWMCLLVQATCVAAYAREKEHPFRDQLRQECRGLIADGVKRPFGLGWEVSAGGGVSTSTPRAVAMGPGTTPAAGIVLLWAAEVLNDAEVRAAGIAVVDGVSASIDESGYLPPIVVWGETPQFKAAMKIGEERAPTAAAVALLCMGLDGVTEAPEGHKLAAGRAAGWLRKQQTPSGAWPRGVDESREIRLDDADYRDCTFASLLYFTVSGDADYRVSTERAVNALTTMRLHPTSPFLPGARLVAGRYALTANGTLVEPAADTPADLLATRYAMQTLLGVQITLDQGVRRGSLVEMVRQVNNLRRQDGKWDRYSSAATDAAWPSGDWGLPGVLKSIENVNDSSRERFIAMLSVGFSPKRHLAAAVSGLWEEPFTLDWPVAATEVDAYLKRHEADWQALSGPVPTEVTARVRRLWILYLRARLEAAATDR